MVDAPLVVTSETGAMMSWTRTGPTSILLMTVLLRVILNPRMNALWFGKSAVLGVKVRVLMAPDDCDEYITVLLEERVVGVKDKESCKSVGMLT